MNDIQSQPSGGSENPESEFASARTRLDNEKRRKAREEYPKKIVEAAKILQGGGAPRT